MGLLLDFEMIQKINDSGLKPPTKLEDIPLFLKNLEQRKEGIQSGQISLELKKEEVPKYVIFSDNDAMLIEFSR